VIVIYKMKILKIILFICIAAPLNSYNFNIDYDKVINYYKVTATVYNAEPSQCNDDYLHTADMSYINLGIVNELRWIAMSRDMIAKFGGDGVFNYGDTVIVHATDSTIRGKWVLRDCMNKRFSNRIDFLQCKQTGFYGKWEDISIYENY